MDRVKAAVKSEVGRFSNSAKIGAELQSIEMAKVSIGQLGTRVDMNVRRTVSGRDSTQNAHFETAEEVSGPGTQSSDQGHPSRSTNPQSQHPLPAEAERVFDNLSKTLAGHSAQLPTDEQENEQKIRNALVESLKNFDDDRTALAKNLTEYKQVFKSQRQWTRVATEIGAAIQISARTVFRLIDDYEHALTGEEVKTMVDLSAIEGDPLSKEDRLFVRARLAIRSALDEVPINLKQQAIAEVLAEEAYQIWGSRNPFQLAIRPRKSRFTIDGRKRIVSTTAKEGDQ